MKRLELTEGKDPQQTTSESSLDGAACSATLYTWSHCADCWQYFGNYKSKTEAEKTIERIGYSRKYCKIELQEVKCPECGFGHNPADDTDIVCNECVDKLSQQNKESEVRSE